MNQVTNLVQWKNLTQEQKKDFDFEDYKYEYQGEHNWWLPHAGICKFERIYRLVIEDDKWYTGFINGELVTCLGSCFDGLNPEILRPAKPDEIPQQEKTLEQKIQEKWYGKEVVMLEPENGMLRIVKTVGACEYDSPHVFAQSMKGFYKYVYDLGGELIADRKPTGDAGNKTIHPVAVLFEE